MSRRRSFKPKIWRNRYGQIGLHARSTRRASSSGNSEKKKWKKQYRYQIVTLRWMDCHDVLHVFIHLLIHFEAETPDVLYRCASYLFVLNPLNWLQDAPSTKFYMYRVSSTSLKYIKSIALIRSIPWSQGLLSLSLANLHKFVRSECLVAWSQVSQG